MANIFDYLKDVAHDSFYDLPWNELDVLALTETTYLSFDNLVSTTPQRLLDLAPQVPLNTFIISLSKRNPSLQKKGKPWDALLSY